LKLLSIGLIEWYQYFFSKSLLLGAEKETRDKLFCMEARMDTIIVCQQCGAKNRIPADKQHLIPKCGRCGSRITGSSATVLELSDKTFDQVVDTAALPVLVDFYSPTCGPCQVLAPVIEQIAGKYGGRAVVCKLDTSRHQMAAARYQIRGVPTLIFFKNGQAVDQVVGAVPAQELEQRLNNLL
jgi:thioredoxin 2